MASPLSAARKQCCFNVLGPAGYGNYIAWKGAAEAKGMNPNECHRWAVDEVDGRPYCAQHAKRQRKLSELAATLDAIDSAPVPNGEVDGVRLIATERSRQIEKEGWTPDHDQGHSTGELAMAAAAYATPADRRKYALGDESPGIWPWDNADWKPTPTDRIRELVKAGALIAAEIDRLLRITETASHLKAGREQGVDTAH